MNDQERILAELWEDGARVEAISRATGLGKDAVYAFAKRLGLGRRTWLRRNVVADPTPEEIAERAAEVRAWNMELKRNETDRHTYERRYYREIKSRRLAD